MSNEILYGVDLFGETIKPETSGPIADLFTMPPFTVLDARSGDWQERKRAWTAIGIQGEIGRGDDLTYSREATHFDYYRIKEGTVNGTSASGGFADKSTGTAGTSIFDPTLCEVAYRWFSPNGGQVIDPFAGGSVRGIVAKSLGRRYWGCDLRQEQVAANIVQAEAIFDGYEGHSAQLEGLGRPDLEWICGDSMDTLAGAPDADFVFSCPPYGDLEEYSNDPRDLSQMDWHAFVAAYKRIIMRCVSKLKPDSFACFVVGDFRCERGFYRNFVSTTIEAFEECGARLYNEAILVTPVGTAAMRVTKQFQSGRKMCKTHQNVLVFCKGDWRKAAAKCNV